MAAQTNVQLLDDTAIVYSNTDATSSLVCVLHRGQEFSIGKALAVAGVVWCQVTLPDGRTGYMVGSINVKTMPHPLVSKALVVFGAGVVLVVLVGIGAAVWDYIGDQLSDELSKDGGRNRVHDWLAKDGLMDKLVQGKMQFSQCAPIDERQIFGPVVVWAFGDDYRDYPGMQVGDGTLGFPGDGVTWAHTNSILIVKLTGAGNETRKVSQDTGNNPLDPAMRYYKEEQIKVYNAEAWLVDKETRQCLGHKTFQPGPDPDSASANSLILSPFVKYYNVNDLRFRAIDHAVKWAKSPQ